MSNAGLTRRGLLGGLGLGALAATLPSFRPRALWAQAMPPPKRLVVVCTSNGTVPARFWPTGSETGFTLSPVLQPLAPYRAKLLILRGVHMASTREGPGAAHQKGIGHLLTGMPLLEGDFAGGGGQSAGWASGISVDQYIANRVAAGSRFPSLQLAVRQGGITNRSRISYTGSNAPMPTIQDPYEAFARIFADVAPGANTELLRAQRRSILDNVTREMTGLQGRVGAEDRRRLEAHMAAIRDIETRLSATSDAVTCTTPTMGTRIDPNRTENYPTIGRLQMDIIAAALACGLTRIVTFQWSSGTSGQTFPWLSISDGHHNLSHEGDTNAAAQDKLTRINRWYAEQFAYLLGKLDAVAEGSGTLLDNTAVLWGNELGKGNTHTRNDIPWVLAGSCGGYFRTGRYLQYSSQPHNNLLVSLCRAMGLTAQRTFGLPAYCTGPLANLT